MTHPLIILVLAAALTQALDFTQQPSMVKGAGSTWTIAFTVDESTDVEVAIVDQTDSSVVRHLAAGCLGANPPAPLIANSLSQSLVWDGLDDYRNTVANTSNIDVRVRAGMGVRLKQAVGGDPYAYHVPGQDRYVYLAGIQQGSDGSVYVLGRPGIFQSCVLRRFTPKGEYVKTIFPISGNQPAEAQGWWGLNALETNEFVPKTKNLFGVAQTISPFGVTFREQPLLLPVHSSGRLGVLTFGLQSSIDDNMVSALPRFTLWELNEDGTRDAACVSVTKSLVTGPVAPPLGKWDLGRLGGQVHCAFTPDSSAFYVSSLFWSNTAVDTAFYREGHVYKVDMATRQASLFFSIDTQITTEAARRTLLGSASSTELQGITVDDSGRVFLCDRLHHRIVILDDAGAILRTIPVGNPDNIAVSKRTGALYVTTHDASTLRLLKFANWRTDDTQTCGVNHAIGSEYYFPKSFLSVCETDEGTIVWLGFWQIGVILYKDEGAALTVYKDFNLVNKQRFTGLYHINVDPKTETPYLDANWAHIFKVPDWNNPDFVQCSTSTGQPLYGMDLALDPLRRYLYFRGGGQTFFGHLYRFTLDDKPAPAPIPGMDSCQLTDTVITIAGTNAVTADCGLAVAPNGQVAIQSWLTGWPVPAPYTGAQEALRFFSLTGEVSNPVHTQGVFTRMTLSKGIKFDFQGNMYIGQKPVSPNVDIPLALKSDAAYIAGTGSIYKYTPDGSLDALLFVDSNPPAVKRYDVDFGPLGDPGCSCVNARFGLDPFGRIYSPNAIFQKVSILDNAGNRIARIGTYGNVDDLSAELAGAAGTTGNCTMGYPMGVDATDDYIYVTDAANYTLLRIQKTFALDNIPGMSTRAAGKSGDESTFSLVCSPNPFNPVVSVLLTGALQEGAQVRVFDLSGRMVADISGKSAWNATGFASGVYVIAAEKGKASVRRKVIYSK